MPRASRPPRWQRDRVIALECPAVVELASDYLDRELDPERHRRVVAHLAGCDACERYVDQVRQTVRLVSAIYRGGSPGTATSIQTRRWSELGNGKSPTRRKSGSSAVGQNTAASTKRSGRDGST
jgi:anti-sigma factor RsiW